MLDLATLTEGTRLRVASPFGLETWTVVGGTATRRDLANDRGGRLSVKARKATGALFVSGTTSFRMVELA